MKALTFVLALFFGVALVFGISKLAGKELNVTVQASGNDYQREAGTRSFEPKATGSMGSGDAVVELTPRLTGNNWLEVSFSINTHSVSLSNIDFMEIATLEHGGRVLRPVKAGRVGGHHSSGKIVFNIGEKISNFRVIIKGIPNIQERVYEWNDG